MRFKFITYCLLMWSASTMCVEPYDIKTKDQNRYLVVDGRITQVDEYNTLRLSWSTPYGYASNGLPIDWAEIKIFNSKGEIGTFNAEGEGYYRQAPGGLVGIVGETYHLEIKIDNEVYKSHPETMPEIVEPDSISLKFGYKSEENEIGNVISFPNVDVLVHTNINTAEKKQYLKWKADEVFSFGEIKCSPLHRPLFCFAQRDTDPDIINVFSGEQLNTSYLNGQYVASKRIFETQWFEFVEKHYFNVYQYSISKDAFIYWDKLGKITQPTGNIFDLPPAAVKGNVYNVNDEDELILGFFEASSIGVARKFTTREDLKPFRVGPKLEYCNTGYCCNCLSITNSTLEEPDYW